MNASLLPLLAACILVVAILYSTVGHGGASGYIAILARRFPPSRRCCLPRYSASFLSTSGCSTRGFS
jgi:hypothetical protein